MTTTTTTKPAECGHTTVMRTSDGQLICQGCGEHFESVPWTLDEVARAHVEKLAAAYPEPPLPRWFLEAQ